MAAESYTMFDTAFGQCGIAWGGRGIVAVQLPEQSESGTRSRLLRRHPLAGEDAPPPELAEAIEALRALLLGENRDLSDIALDLHDVPRFDRRVYAVARGIPPGATLTYGMIASRLGEPGAARAVGRALGKNPVPLIVPCHRVVAARGRLGGFSARGGAATKARLLTVEARHTRAAPMLFEALPWAAPPARPT